MAEVILSAKVPIYVHVSVDGPDREQTNITKVVVGDEELPADSAEFDVVEVSGDTQEERRELLDKKALEPLIEQARDAVGDPDIMWPGWRFDY